MIAHLGDNEMLYHIIVKGLCGLFLFYFSFKACENNCELLTVS